MALTSKSPGDGVESSRVHALPLPWNLAFMASSPEGNMVPVEVIDVVLRCKPHLRAC